MNTYYGTAHFFVTLGIFILLFKRRPDVFGQWRNTLAAMTGLAIIGFVLFPLMPPRLLDAPCPKDGVGLWRSMYSSRDAQLQRCTDLRI